MLTAEVNFMVQDSDDDLEMNLREQALKQKIESAEQWIQFQKLQLGLHGELRTAFASYRQDDTKDNRARIEELLGILRIVNTNDLPPTWHNMLGLIAVATGVTGFDEAGNANIDRDRIDPLIQAALCENRVFQSLTNDCLREEFGATLDFSRVK